MLLLNRFAPPEVVDEQHSTSWLYEEADRLWASWLPAEVSSTIRYGGYYTTLVKPGLRMVSMNMNYCYTFNWWALAKSQDPASGLLWLTKVLEKAEMDGEKVFRVDFNSLTITKLATVKFLIMKLTIELGSYNISYCSGRSGLHVGIQS